MTDLSFDVMTPLVWSDALSGPPVLDRVVHAAVPALVRRWQGVDPEINQSALDHHYVSIHLGGAKRLSRTGEGTPRSCETINGAHSVVPAGAAFQWNTQGAVDFVHFYFAVAAFDRVIEEAFDRDPAGIGLNEALGVDDPLISTLASAVIDELQDTAPCQRVYLDELMHLLALRILRMHSNVRESTSAAAQLLAPFRLRRAIDFIEEHLASPIGVAEIATAAGISAYHFSRAFRQATGKPPYAYLLDRRLARARQLLGSTDASLTAVSTECGFNSLSQFSRSFSRGVGVTPTAYRHGR